jgi:LPXTG-site transpeptidase (sortase) family protein
VAQLPVRAASPDEEPVWPAAQSQSHKPEVASESNTPGTAPARKQSTKGLGARATVLYVLAGILFIAGGLVAWQGFSANQQIEEQIAETNDVANDDGSRPATSPVDESAVDGYVVAPNLPRVLTIDKLGVKARIMPLGVTSANKLKAPSNIYDVGWYNASAQPGQPGAMLMDGHVSSWTSDGVFKNIKKLVPGDVMTVERGDGEKLQFRVVKSQAYEESATDMRAALLPVTEGKNGLNLITCYGRVRPGTSEFEQRLIVFTEQI